MISFRKFVMVGAMLAAFAGLAAAQTVTSFGIQPNAYPTLRQEGLTEPLPTLTFTLTTTGAAMPAAGAVVNYDLTILANGGAPFTSPADTIMVGAAANANTSVSGPIVRIPGVAFTFGNLLLATQSATATVTISGLRIDANALGVNSFASIQATAFPTNGVILQNGVGLTAVSSSTTNVATVATSLKTTISADTSNNLIKHSTTSGAWTSSDAANGNFDPTNTDPTKLTQPALFTTTFTPQYAGAFWTLAVGENKLRFAFSVTNIPSGLALYVPQFVGGSQAHPQLALVLGTDATGANGYVAPATLAAYPVPANGMVVYEQEIDNGGTTGYTVPVYSVGTTPLALTSTAAPFTYNGGYAPMSTDLSAKDSSPVLRFTNVETEFDSFLVVVLPTSKLAFPYVANGSGWVTAIAIMNGGSGWDSASDVAAGAPGSCTLTFYSADGTTPAPAKATVPPTGTTIPAGGYYAFLLDTPLGGTAVPYNGIVYATCNFDNAKGFTYLNGDGTTAGYLALPE